MRNLIGDKPVPQEKKEQAHCTFSSEMHELRFTFSLSNMKKLHLHDPSVFLTLHNDITVLTKCWVSY